MSHRGLGGYFDVRVCLAGGEVSQNVEGEEVPRRVARAPHALGLEAGRPIARVDLSVAPRRCAITCGRSKRAGPAQGLLSSLEREEIKTLRREVAQMPRANESLKVANVFSRASSIYTVRTLEPAEKLPRTRQPVAILGARTSVACSARLATTARCLSSSTTPACAETVARAKALGITVPLFRAFPCTLDGHDHDARLHFTRFRGTERGFWQ
jgi:hypothetical protein